MAKIQDKEETVSELAKSNFLARMSHEMRTPLNAIIGMSTIAQTTVDLEKISRCLVKINEASMHLLGMINDVLDLAKIEAGNFKLSNEEFKFPLMLSKTADAAKFALDAKKQNMILELDPNLPETLITDQQRLAQVLDNLISNAVKFTPPEGTITLSAKSLGREGKTSTLEFKVIDTGIGISKDGLKNIFNLFEQGDGTTARKYGGTGVGLAISSSIVRLMNGTIQVESKPGKGACFSFNITVEHGKKEETKSQPSHKTNDPGVVKEELDFTGSSILLVEDVEINREIVLALLEDSGIVIDCAENGLIALDMYKKNPSKYCVILMDIHMPEMDGFEATRQIRAFENDHAPESPGSGIPIIAMTANVFKDDVEKCLAVGMTSHLGKPIDLEQLMEQLAKYITDNA